MVSELETRKLNLIQEIINLKNEKILNSLEEKISELKKMDNLWEIVKPIKKAISIEEIIEEQNYKPISKKEFDKKAAALNIEEPLEELLEMLSK